MTDSNQMSPPCSNCERLAVRAGAAERERAKLAEGHKQIQQELKYSEQDELVGLTPIDLIRDLIKERDHYKREAERLHSDLLCAWIIHEQAEIDCEGHHSRKDCVTCGFFQQALSASDGKKT